MSSGSTSAQDDPALPDAASALGSASPSPSASPESPPAGKRSNETRPTDRAAGKPLYVVLTGNPNCGKTTLFNALTGLRAKVGNYAGVTVERKEGRMLGTAPPNAITILDLP